MSAPTVRMGVSQPHRRTVDDRVQSRRTLLRAQNQSSVHPASFFLPDDFAIINHSVLTITMIKRLCYGHQSNAHLSHRRKTSQSRYLILQHGDDDHGKCSSTQLRSTRAPYPGFFNSRMKVPCLLRQIITSGVNLPRSPCRRGH